MDNIEAQKLFREIIEKLGFQNEGYVLTISRRLRHNFAYINLTSYLKENIREIVISEKHVNYDSFSEVQDTILHEISHFIQYVEAIKILIVSIPLRFRKQRITPNLFNVVLISHLKRYTTSKAKGNKNYYWKPYYMHNDRFIEIFEELKSKLGIKR